jgi:hypothetical protein
VRRRLREAERGGEETAGSAGEELSRGERGWELAGCIMGMSECWVVGESPECDVPVECDGSREPIRVPGGADDRLRDVGLLVVGRHGNKGPDGPLPLRPGRRVVDEEDRLLIEVHLGRAGVARRRPRPLGHRGASRECAGSAGVLSGRERFG